MRNQICFIIFFLFQKPVRGLFEDGNEKFSNLTADNFKNCVLCSSFFFLTKHFLCAPSSESDMNTCLVIFSFFYSRPEFQQTSSPLQNSDPLIKHDYKKAFALSRLFNYFLIDINTFGCFVCVIKSLT